MKNQFKQLLLALTLPAIFLTSCSGDDDAATTANETSDTNLETSTYSLLANIDDAYYLAQTEDLTEGTLSFVDNGTQLDSDLAAKVLRKGDYLYSLNYGTGILTQLSPQDDGSYTTIKEIDAGLAVGTTTPRYKIADDNTLMVYNVTTEAVTNDADEITDYVCTLRFAAIDIPALTISNLTEFVIPQSENAKIGGSTGIGYHPMRVDSPVISGDKIYFGLMHLDIQSSPIPPFRTPKQTGLETLVFDYPAISNGVIVESSEASGHTSGYRAPSMHADENGDVYQSNWFMSGNSFDLSNGDKTVISKLTNGVYDASYEFNVSEALGLTSNVATVGWFYVGNGIGYMPIQLEDEGNYYSEDSWSLARIDVYNKTAVKLNVTLSNLFEYESGIVDNGNFYMAISPADGDSYIYEFDVTSTSADGFSAGLQMDGGSVSVEGIYLNN